MYITSKNIKLCDHYGNYFEQFLKKLNIEYQSDPAILLSNVYIKYLKRGNSNQYLYAIIFKNIIPNN